MFFKNIFAGFIVISLFFLMGCSDNEISGNSIEESVVEETVVEIDNSCNLSMNYEPLLDMSINRIAEVCCVDPVELLELFNSEYQLKYGYCVDCTIYDMSKEVYITVKEVEGLADSLVKIC